MNSENEVELIVVGGGPAGLSAALAAARAAARARRRVARRRVALVDGGTPRNAKAPAIHTFVSRDGVRPEDFRREARAQLAVYPTVSFHAGLVTEMEEGEGGWRVRLEGGEVLSSGKVLLATGLVDELPEIPGVRENWGAGVHHCPFCDGFEHRDQAWGVLLEDPAMAGHVAIFKGWSGDLRVFTNGRDPGGEALELLRAAEIPVETARVAEVVAAGDGHALKKVVLADGREVAIESLWIRPKQSQSRLVTALGLALREDGAVACDELGESSRAGVYVAGDVIAGPAQQALLAAADGARVAFGIICELVMGVVK